MPHYGLNLEAQISRLNLGILKQKSTGSISASEAQISKAQLSTLNFGNRSEGAPDGVCVPIEGRGADGVYVAITQLSLPHPAHLFSRRTPQSVVVSEFTLSFAAGVPDVAPPKVADHRLTARRENINATSNDYQHQDNHIACLIAEGVDRVSVSRPGQSNVITGLGCIRLDGVGVLSDNI